MLHQPEKRKWILEHGIHQHTITSRDSGNPEEFDTREDAIKMFERHKQFYHSIGYVIWFAYLTDPDGNQVLLEQNGDY